ncbi:MAG TPA: aldo/keto reductase [Anaerolineaceae bacterium]|nr:aldo/keto reductase [Anaerolineaceae bacterium]
MFRQLGRSGLQVSALGFGANALGGDYWDRTKPVPEMAGYGPVDDAESLRAAQRALDLGVNFFDTAEEYGCGYSERIIGKALSGCRERVILATKFGYTLNETRREITGTDTSPRAVRQACEASLRRMQTDYIDLYQLHLRQLDLARAAEVRETLEDLAHEGKIRYYGWSTDDPERARLFAQGEHCAAIHHRLNLFCDHPAMLAVCAEQGLASLNRIPLLMGILTGRFSAEGCVPALQNSPCAQQDLEAIHALTEVLTARRHTLVQGALAWIWTRSPLTIPIPVVRSARQVEENAAALHKGLLTLDQMEAVERLLGRE